MSFVCLCHGINSRQIREEIHSGAYSVEEIGRRCGAGTCCLGCHPTIEAMLERSVAVERRPRMATA
ncbi:MAG: (2Fe-2S)-binding protein [Actinomycetota bacterium]|nr:(2Fe-2S)-binding protein [Actinomycetota bacterium]